jgi:hypothetical protein
MDQGRARIRRAMLVVVIGVDAIAAVVSYSHIHDLALARGESATTAALLPLSVDGLLLAASLVLLHEVLAGRRPPLLPRVMLGLGVLATLAANVAYGVSSGWVGAVISAWPAVAFVGATEMLIGLFRASIDQVAADPGGSHRQRLPGSSLEAARMAFQATADAGNPLSERALAGRFGITRSEAKQIVTGSAQLAGLNGHGGSRGFTP